MNTDKEIKLSMIEKFATYKTVTYSVDHIYSFSTEAIESVMDLYADFKIDEFKKEHNIITKSKLSDEEFKQKLENKETSNFIHLIKTEDFEFGYIPKSEVILREFFKGEFIGNKKMAP